MIRTPFSIARRLTAMGLSVVLGTGLIVAVSAAPASAEDVVTIGGTVTAEVSSGVFQPKAGVQVTLYDVDDSGDPGYSVPSGADGAFSMHVSPGRYRVRFEPNNWDAAAVALAPTWLGDTPYEAQSQIIDVGSGSVGNLDAQLEIGSSISGVISYAEGAEHAAAASAFLYDQVSGEYERSGYRALPDSNGNYSIRGLPAGIYTLRFGDSNDQTLVSTEYWEDADYLFRSAAVELPADTDLTGHDGTVGPGGVWMYRLAGVDRLDTSVQISQAGFGDEGSDAVFIVNGLNFPDALSAGPAAARIFAPVLLVTPWGIPQVVKDELARLSPSTVYIVGGEPSVSAAVEAELAGSGAEVLRFAGADRFETSRLVADHFWAGDDNRTAYLATGMNFPDALSAAPAAANEYAPVILVNGGLSAVDSGTAALLEQLNIEKVVITGGAPSVSTGMKTSIDELPFIVESYRRNGTDRLDTSVRTNEKSFPLADTAFLATGWGFPDALAGAALAGSWFAPIYLTPPNCVPDSVLDEIGRLHVTDVFLLGGEPTLSNEVMNLIPC